MANSRAHWTLHLFIRAPAPSWVGEGGGSTVDLITSQGPHLQTPSHQGLDFDVWILGGHIQSIIDIKWEFKVFTLVYQTMPCSNFRSDLTHHLGVGVSSKRGRHTCSYRSVLGSIHVTVAGVARADAGRAWPVSLWSCPPLRVPSGKWGRETARFRQGQGQHSEGNRARMWTAASVTETKARRRRYQTARKILFKVQLIICSVPHMWHLPLL